MATKTFLMCEPTYFGVDWEINPWMSGNIGKVNKDKALAQWNRLANVIREHASVVLIEPVPGLCDMVFTANAGAVFNQYGQVWLSAFKHQERQHEEHAFHAWFVENGWSVVREYTTPDRHSTPRAFEGAGDCLRDGSGAYWVAYGQRSTQWAVERLSSFYQGEDITHLEVSTPHFYHLDTCFCPLDAGLVLWYPEAFSELSRNTIRGRLANRLIDVDEADARLFACNAVDLGDGTIVMPYASKNLKLQLQKHGYNVVIVDMSEFMKSGGAAKCLTLDVTKVDRIVEPKEEFPYTVIDGFKGVKR